MTLRDPVVAHDAAARATVRWVLGLFVMCVVLQRFAVPNSEVALLIPAVLLWCLRGWRLGLVVVDRGRACLWLVAFGLTALVMPLQGRLVSGASVSVTSWGLFLVVWAPFVLRLVDARTSTYLLLLRRVADVGVGLAALCIVMIATQVAGLPYVDWFGAIVPPALQLDGFVITYSVAYDDDLQRANAWIGLEPSMVSAQLGLAVLAAFYTGASGWRLTVLLLGMVCTLSGSGFALVAVGLLVMVVHPVRRVLTRSLPVAAVVLAAWSTTKYGAILRERVTEFQSADSSTSLRATEPYRHLWAPWIDDRWSVLLGRGPGSAQELIANTNIAGLLVPSPAKVFFEYGLLAGAALAAFLLACYVAGPSRGFSVSLLLSLWLLQPGTTTLLVVAPLLIFVTLWSPRAGPVLESRHVQHLRPGRRAASLQDVAP